MKENVWVCRHDGTIQCESFPEITLADMRNELAALIGEDNILDMKKEQVMMPSACGLPTGGINSYEITPAGWHLLTHGISGPNGFFKCRGNQTEAANVQTAISAAAERTPKLIRELVGHPIRVYTTGDALTEDFRPDRFNVELSVDDVIVSTWFG